jgi:Na+-transporting NADH:ubiquinone oxidoreductase subunit NqrD
MLLALRQMSPSALSPDATLHGRISGKVLELCTELGVGTTSDTSKSLGLVVSIAVNSGSELVSLVNLHKTEY